MQAADLSALDETVTAPQPQPRAPFWPLRVLLLLCVVVPAGLFAIVAYYRLEQIGDETGVRLNRAVRIAQEHAQKVFDTNEILLAHMLDLLDEDDDARLRAREKQLHDQLAAIARKKAQIQSVWAIGADGHALATSFTFPAPAALNFSDRPYFQWHQQKRGGIFVTEVLLGKATKTEFFDMSRGRYRADGSFAGTVSVSLLPSYFAGFYADLVADEPGLAVNLLRAGGEVYARWPQQAGAPARLDPRGPVMTEISKGHNAGSVVGVSSMDQRRRLIMYRKIGEHPVYVGVGMDMAYIDAKWRAEMLRLGGFALPAMLGLMGAAVIASRRTREALDAAQRLESESVARRKVEQTLLQAQKLETLGQLTGGVAHDFNNALAVIIANLYLQRKKYPQADDKFLAAMERAADAATRLTRQLLAFSRSQPLVPEQVQLQQRLLAVADLIGPILGSSTQLLVHVDPATSPILVDPAEFELALLNLAINARDAMPQGGQLSIRVGNEEGALPPPLAGRFVQVEVRDSGAGIARALLPKVFEPFFTTKPVGSGTGLGLSQVYGLCKRAGGIATIDSVVGSGTTVRLYFPAQAQLQVAPAAERSGQRGPLGMRILLVEDNPDLAVAVRAILESLECKVSWLGQATLARDWLEQQVTAPDLLLTDVVMPGAMDGLALAQHVRAQYPAMAIVVMTAYAQQLEAITQQGFDVIPKPCTAAALATALAKASAQARA